MGPYRNPPSVSSAISNSTYTSDYANLMSPGKDFEAFDESNVSRPQKVTGRRNTKRRTSSGKVLKRLVSSAKTAKSTMGKPYPPASARNGRLSRFQHGEYHENNCKFNTTVALVLLCISLVSVRMTLTQYLLGYFTCSARGVVEYAEERGEIVSIQSRFPFR